MGTRRALPAAAALAAGALLLGACTYRVRERDLFHPKRLPELGDAVVRRNVTVRAADGTALRGWFLSVPGSRRALLWFYGNGETAFESSLVLYPLAERFGADVLAVDYRGYGWSDGEPTIAAIAEDAPLLVDELRALAGPGKPVFVAGRSLGAAFALRAALDRDPAGLVLVSPPSTIGEVVRAWERNAPWYLRPFLRLRPDAALEAVRPRPVDAVAELSVPLLVIHGTEDRTIPFPLGRALYERAGSTRKSFCEVAGAGHNDLDLLRGPAAVCLGRFVEEVDPRLSTVVPVP